MLDTTRGDAFNFEVKVDLFGYDENSPAVKWLEEGGLFSNLQLPS